MKTRIAAAAMAALCLSGCISLLPKTKPAQLYRFGLPPAASAAEGPEPAAGRQFAVRAASLTFERAAASDRILTIDGDQAAYVAGSRWVTSAVSLFDAAMTSAFDRHQGPARLLAPGEPSIADYTLKVDVRAFEARYRQGAGAAPTVVVEAYVALVRRGDLTDDHHRIFTAATPASSNTLRGIAAAFDLSVAKVLNQIVAWVDAKGAG